MYRKKQQFPLGKQWMALGNSVYRLIRRRSIVFSWYVNEDLRVGWDREKKVYMDCQEPNWGWESGFTHGWVKNLGAGSSVDKSNTYLEKSADKLQSSLDRSAMILRVHRCWWSLTPAVYVMSRGITLTTLEKDITAQEAVKSPDDRWTI